MCHKHVKKVKEMDQSIETYINTPQKMYMTAGHNKMFSAEKGIVFIFHSNFILDSKIIF